MMNLLVLSTILISTLSFGSELQADKLLEVRDVPNNENFQNFRYENFDESIKAQRGFPLRKIRAYDPINKETYQYAIAGKTFKASAFKSYDYWRYVTVYNVDTVAERVSYLPYFEESCHDSSFFMAQWGETRNFKVSMTSSVGAKVGVEGLGLDASVSMSIEQGVAFSTSRRVQAVKGIHARHFPYKLSDTWSGVTFIQTYNESTKSLGYLLPSYYDRLFGEYPYTFSLDNQNVGFKVERKILNTCEGYDPSIDPINADDLYLSGEYIRNE